MSSSALSSSINLDRMGKGSGWKASHDKVMVLTHRSMLSQFEPLVRCEASNHLQKPDNRVQTVLSDGPPDGINRLCRASRRCQLIYGSECTILASIKSTQCERRWLGIIGHWEMGNKESICTIGSHFSREKQQQQQQKVKLNGRGTQCIKTRLKEVVESRLSRELRWEWRWRRKRRTYIVAFNSHLFTKH